VRDRSFDSETCIAVQWGWIAYPAVLVLGTLAFSVQTAARSGNRDEWPQQAYKTSILLFIFHGLEESEAQVKAAELEDMSRIHAAAERTEIRFQKRDKGWHFVEM